MANDLDARIRARLDVIEDDLKPPIGSLIDAITAALDEHTPHLDDPGKCSCIEYDDVYVANNYPCRTKRAIAAKLGIEVND